MPDARLECQCVPRVYEEILLERTTSPSTKTMPPDDQQPIHFVLTGTKINARAARRKARSHSALVAHAQARRRRAATRRHQVFLKAEDDEDAAILETRRLAHNSQHDELHSAGEQYRVATRLAATNAAAVSWQDHNWLTLPLSSSAILTAGDRLLLHYCMPLPDLARINASTIP